MKCPKCGTQAIKADAGILRSIPYDYCPKCKTEIGGKTLQQELEEFFTEEEEELLLWGHPVPTSHKSLSPYTSEIIHGYKVLFDNTTAIYSEKVEIINDSSDQLEVRVETASGPSNVWPEFLNAKGNHRDTDVFVVPIGSVLTVTSKNPPQDLRWRVL